jgi:hypothetical protein
MTAQPDEKKVRKPPGLYQRGTIWWMKYYVNGHPVINR